MPLCRLPSGCISTAPASERALVVTQSFTLLRRQLRGLNKAAQQRRPTFTFMESFHFFWTRIGTLNQPGWRIRRRDSVLDCGDGVCAVTALASALRKRCAVRNKSWALSH